VPKHGASFFGETMKKDQIVTFDKLPWAGPPREIYDPDELKVSRKVRDASRSTAKDPRGKQAQDPNPKVRGS